MEPIPTLSSPRTAGGWGHALVMAVVVGLAYSGVRHAGFVWDDDSHLTNNPCIIGPLGLKEIWTSPAANYFPLVLTNFWVQHALWGLAPAPYHMVNVLFHAANAVLLFFVLRQLRVPGAWLGALLWALHPVQVESVGWISELKNTQSGLFYLMAIACFIRWLRPTEGAGEPSRLSGAYLAAWGSAVLAVLSKPSTVMLPVILGLVWWWMARGWRWRRVVWLAPFFLISLAASGWTIWEQKYHSMAQGAEWKQTLVERLLVAGRVPWFYLGKLAWPEPLMFIYPRWSVSAGSVVDWLPLAWLLAAAVGLWWWREGRARPVSLAAAYFAVSLFPVLDLFDVYFFRYSFVGDHFQYLASIGPLALVGAGFATLASRYGPGMRWAARGGAGLVCAVLGWLTWQQCGTYHDDETLWRDTLARNPGSWLAHNNLGVIWEAGGQVSPALAEYEAALRLRPDYFEARLNLGTALGKSPARSAEAITQLEAALRLRPDSAVAHYNLGNAYLRLPGHAGDAREQYEKALRLKPDLAQAHYNLAVIFANGGQPELAIPHLEAAVRLDRKWDAPRQALAQLRPPSGR